MCTSSFESMKSCIRCPWDDYNKNLMFGFSFSKSASSQTSVHFMGIFHCFSVMVNYTGLTVVVKLLFSLSSSKNSTASCKEVGSLISISEKKKCCLANEWAAKRIVCYSINGFYKTAAS